ncbi:FmdB family zinc ribbon protein [Nonomuraea roseoviolacea]|uniref:FmdB family zinc ribbon protein n=1 Tax=Nonomuraea roseoviolacea TaxID=103837 RepID=UPI0026468968|nr:zinc ribbon domain-containing protein [Nonomuraea roseoviolacea]
MATYEYRCRDCGRFEVRLPIGTAAAACDCPECHGPASRVFSSPYLSQLSPATARARSREEQSREAPEVVTSVPSPRRRQQPPHPALQRLPRP